MRYLILATILLAAPANAYWTERDLHTAAKIYTEGCVEGLRSGTNGFGARWAQRRLEREPKYINEVFYEFCEREAAEFLSRLVDGVRR